MKNYIYSGESLTFVATEKVSSGQGYVLGDIFGVVANTTDAGQSNELFVEGVFGLDKDPTVEIPNGKKIYWDQEHHCVTVLPASTGTSAQPSTSTPSSLVYIGVAAEYAAKPIAYVRVRLNGVP